MRNPWAQFLHAATQALPNAAAGDTRGAVIIHTVYRIYVPSYTPSPCLCWRLFKDGSFGISLVEGSGGLGAPRSDPPRVRSQWTSSDVAGRAAEPRCLHVRTRAPSSTVLRLSFATKRHRAHHDHVWALCVGLQVLGESVVQALSLQHRTHSSRPH